MATQNITNEDPCGKDRDLLCEYKTHLINEVELLDGAALAAITTQKSQQATRDNKVCCLLKAEDTADIYRNIDFYVAIGASCTTEEIEKNVGDLTKKGEDLAKAITEVVTYLKGIKSKAQELKAKVCDLDTQVKDSCNSQQLLILNNYFKDKCKQNDTQGILADYADFTAIVAGLNTQTETIWQEADQAFNDAVSIAGIQTFSNVSSLKDLSKTLLGCVKDFKKNVEDNIKSSGDDVKKAQEDLASCIKGVASQTIVEHRATTLFEGTAFALEFACDPDCNCTTDPNTPTVNEICEKVMKTHCSTDKGKGEYTPPNID